MPVHGLGIIKCVTIFSYLNILFIMYFKYVATYIKVYNPDIILRDVPFRVYT